MIASDGNGKNGHNGEGGLGGISAPMGIRDLRMHLRAMRWGVQGDDKELVLDEARNGLRSKESSERYKAVCMKVFLEAEKQNQADEHKATPDLHLHAHKSLDKEPDEKVQRLSSLAEEFEQVAGQDLLEE